METLTSSGDCKYITKFYKLNLGCGNSVYDDYINIDKSPTQPNVYSFDLEKPLPFLDNSVTYVKAYHILEHINNLEGLMHELNRVCLNDSDIDIVVPLAHTLWDVADPTHVRRFNHKTFEYYCGNKTSYDRPHLFDIIYQGIEREKNEMFDGIEWIVANLHVILKVVK